MPPKRRSRYQEIEYYNLSPETKRGIFIIALFLVALLSILSFLNLAGTAGLYIDLGLGLAFGWGRYLFPLVLIGLGYALARPEKYHVSIANIVGILLFYLSIHGLLHLNIPDENKWDLALSGLGGGALGHFVVLPFQIYLGPWASLIILFGTTIIGILLMFNTSVEGLLAKMNILKFIPRFRQEKAIGEEISIDEEEAEEIRSGDGKEAKTEEVKFSAKSLLGKKPDSAPTIRNPKIKIDLPMNLLDDKVSKPQSGDIKLGMEKIQRTLQNFHIDVEMGDVQVGPTVTQYTLKPAEGIKLARITALHNDLALSLAAHPIRIEAPIPGKSLVGIEVPNRKPAIVRIREILESMAFKKRTSNLTIALGKDVSGKCWAANVNDMPHLLVAGASGSGKSVYLHAVIISLLYQNNPETLRLILIDPKRVELPIYNGIPHLLTPVITDVTKTVYALRWTISEMDRRFDILAKTKKRNIDSYNLTSEDKMPHLIIIIDELADLMVAAAAEVEACIIRLTQMARAVGIHLVVATQRPSVDVITGLIKANIPCRIAFSVASLVDSRTILDCSGAEKLVGRGDMLYMSPQTAKPFRLQGAYISDHEKNNIVNFLRNACGNAPDYQEEIMDKPSSATSFDFQGGSDDELFNEAKEIVVRSGKASASLLQRRLRIGYARAARLIDLLEEAGIVGPGEGAKPREILIDKIEALTKNAEEEMIEEEETEKDEEAAEETAEDETVGDNDELSDLADDDGKRDVAEDEEEDEEDDEVEDDEISSAADFRTEDDADSSNQKPIKEKSPASPKTPNKKADEDNEIY